MARLTNRGAATNLPEEKDHQPTFILLPASRCGKTVEQDLNPQPIGRWTTCYCCPPRTAQLEDDRTSRRTASQMCLLPLSKSSAALLPMERRACFVCQKIMHEIDLKEQTEASLCFTPALYLVLPSLFVDDYPCLFFVCFF